MIRRVMLFGLGVLAIVGITSVFSGEWVKGYALLSFTFLSLFVSIDTKSRSL